MITRLCPPRASPVHFPYNGLMTDPHDPQSSTSGLGKGMVIAGWLIALGLLTLFFSDQLDQQRNPNQAVESHMLEDGVREVQLQRNRHGHYVATGEINDASVEFMLDTGATAVSVPSGLAERLGLRRGAPITTRTANGTITTYATMLDRIALGDIEVRNVRATINPYSDQILVGMSFLRNLEFTQRGDTLTLRQYAN